MGVGEATELTRKMTMLGLWTVSHLFACWTLASLSLVAITMDSHGVSWFSSQVDSLDTQGVGPSSDTFKAMQAVRARHNPGQEFDVDGELETKQARGDQGDYEDRYETAGMGSMDEAKALELYQEQAVEGNADGQFNLGACFHSGKGVERDLETAQELYLKVRVPLCLLCVNECRVFRSLSQAFAIQPLPPRVTLPYAFRPDSPPCILRPRLRATQRRTIIWGSCMTTERGLWTRARTRLSVTTVPRRMRATPEL